MSIFSSGPKYPPVTPAVTDTTAEVKAAAQSEAEKLRRRRGARSTIMTSSSGVTTAPTTVKATLG